MGSSAPEHKEGCAVEVVGLNRDSNKFGIAEHREDNKRGFSQEGEEGNGRRC